MYVFIITMGFPQATCLLNHKKSLLCFVIPFFMSATIVYTRKYRYSYTDILDNRCRNLQTSTGRILGCACRCQVPSESQDP